MHVCPRVFFHTAFFFVRPLCSLLDRKLDLGDGVVAVASFRMTNRIGMVWYEEIIEAAYVVLFIYPISVCSRMLCFYPFGLYSLL